MLKRASVSEWQAALLQGEHYIMDATTSDRPTIGAEGIATLAEQADRVADYAVGSTVATASSVPLSQLEDRQSRLEQLIDDLAETVNAPRPPSHSRRRDREYRDSAYLLEPWLLTSVPGHPDEDTPEGVYNKEHAALWSTVERCIGLLKSRFRCLQRYRALHYGPSKAGTIVAACASLHNLCLEEPQDSDGDEEDDEPDTSRTIAPPRRRALYSRGRATCTRQIVQLNISRADSDMFEAKKPDHVMHGIEKQLFAGLMLNPSTSVNDFLKEAVAIKHPLQLRYSQYACLYSGGPIDTTGVIVVTATDESSLCQLIRAVVQEEVKKLTTTSNECAIRSVTEVVRWEIRQALSSPEPHTETRKCSYMQTSAARHCSSATSNYCQQRLCTTEEL
ncbi:hypothetical protein HPB52_000119 [Rhipicephalus sanguineus]|uniref:DDE Tnp4 domain-containing protein n=1 Tax=Rhipicephalus sanguineus TaxID=34632 RepID=A0A9D4Q4N3_RHISA|nr:hypothetical protein HPB52_000119 [Rhipicephalus sanguineus]